jgi:O-antigen ligase
MTKGLRLASTRAQWNGRTRLYLLVIAGLLVLQSSQSLDILKGAYLICAAVVFTSGVIAVFRKWSTPIYVILRPMLVPSFALIALLALSFPVALTHGTTFSAWLRDGATYGLFALGPIAGADAAETTSRRELTVLLVAVGVVAAVSFAIQWLGARDIVQFPIQHLVYPSGQIGAALLAYGAARATGADRSRLWWALLAGVVFAAFLVTGTRSSFLMFAGPLVIAFVVGRSRIAASVSMLGATAAAAALAVAAFTGVLVLAQLGAAPVGTAASPTLTGTTAGPTAGATAGATAGPTAGTTAGTTAASTPRPDIIVQRLGSAFNGLSTPGAGSSLQDRIAQTKAAWTTFLANPIFGTGPGHSIAWSNYQGEAVSSYVLDTPLIFLSAFGLLGLLVLIGWMAGYVAVARTVLGTQGASVEWLAWVGFGASLLAALALTMPAEDKGTAFAIAILVAMLVAPVSRLTQPETRTA